jgi:hypothetical protein
VRSSGGNPSGSYCCIAFIDAGNAETAARDTGIGD